MNRFLPFIVITWFAAIGCSTHADRAREIRSAYHSGNTTEAKLKIDAAIQKHERDADVLKLDKATTLLMEGNSREAEAIFREVRDRFEEKEGNDLREGVASLLTDDQRLAYSGEDYEKVLIRFYLSLANLMHDGSDAAAYALQVNEKQQQIIEAAKGSGTDGGNLKASYKLVGAGAYLHAALREETHTNYDDVARSLELVAKWQPEFKAVTQDLERAKNGRHSQPNHGVAYIFTLVGRGPYKEERAEVVTQVALLIADRIISALGKQSLPPTLAPVKVPVVVLPFNQVDRVGVAINGKLVGMTDTITDVGQMAIQQSQANLPSVIARAVVRRAVKKGIVVGAKELVGTDQTQMTSLAMNAVGVLWEATESADTRCWSLLPNRIQALRVELPVGTHQIALQPMGLHGAVGTPETIQVQIENGRNTYLLANFPSIRIAGKVISNRHVQ